MPHSFPALACEPAGLLAIAFHAFLLGFCLRVGQSANFDRRLVGVTPKSLLSLLVFLIAAASTYAQRGPSYPLAITDRALMNPEVLHARNWPSMIGLPPVAIERTNAGERWYLIETARGQFDPNLGNLFTPGTGWVDVAEKNHTAIIYTFNTVPPWAARQEGDRPARVAPYDIDDENEKCQAPLDGVTSPNGNCIWKEWVTALMQKNCGVTAKPAHPLQGQCRIRNFETWNEFNAELFWQDSLAHLAKMANDMTVIVRSYCGDCTIVGGSVSAGGVGRSGNGPSGSGSFAQALGQFLDAWHAIPNASLPDAVSFHAYPSRTNVSYPPFPESNVSLNDAKCAAGSVPNVHCEHPMVNQPQRVREVLAARSWLPASMPIWNTESGWNTNKTLLHGTDAEGHADEETGILRQAYLARLEVLMANEGVAVNIWYEADHQCTGTLVGFGLPLTSGEFRSCPNDPPIPSGLTPAGRALSTIYQWLHGGTFTGPCKSQGDVWWCPVAGPGSGEGVIAWTTKWKGEESVSQLPGKYPFAHTLNGESLSVRGGDKAVEFRPRLFNSSN